MFNAGLQKKSENLENQGVTLKASSQSRACISPND